MVVYAKHSGRWIYLYISISLHPAEQKLWSPACTQYYIIRYTSYKYILYICVQPSSFYKSCYCIKIFCYTIDIPVVNSSVKKTVYFLYFIIYANNQILRLKTVLKILPTQIMKYDSVTLKWF